MENKDLLGKEVVGFKFKDSFTLGYNSNMNKYISKKGKIIKTDSTGCLVNFDGSESYWYPLEKIEEQLTETVIVQPELTLEEILEKIKNL